MRNKKEYYPMIVYVVYKITNIINQNIYIGIHKTNDICDNYYGSGKLIRAAIKKHGKDNFVKEILHICDTLDSALLLEKEIVNEDFTKRRDTYNIAVGGGLGGKTLNGLTFVNRTHTEETKNKLRNIRLGKSFITDEGRKKIIHNNMNNEERKQKISNCLAGRVLSESHKNNIKKSMLNRPPENIPRGYKRNNSQKWINNGIISTRINVADEIPLGFTKGRK
jgi:group I intron endonuclease